MMAGAAETEICTHPEWLVLTHTAVSAVFTSTATENNCPGILYMGCIWTCLGCGEQKRDNYETAASSSHSYVTEMVEGTIKTYCSRCRFEQPPIQLR